METECKLAKKGTIEATAKHNCSND